jgi:hypothetical protein
MKYTKLIGITLAILTAGAAVFAQTKAKTPEAFLADLYKVHEAKRGPFYQTKSRAQLDKYFEKDLADMIWKDRISAKEEVGVLDGDPLYDAQDFEIKKFAIGKAEVEGAKARVNVTFENFGQPKKLLFILGKGTSGWRINDIDYGAQGTLRSWFKQGAK